PGILPQQKQPDKGKESKGKLANRLQRRRLALFLYGRKIERVPADKNRCASLFEPLRPLDYGENNGDDAGRDEQRRPEFTQRTRQSASPIRTGLRDVDGSEDDEEERHQNPHQDHL